MTKLDKWIRELSDEANALHDKAKNLAIDAEDAKSRAIRVQEKISWIERGIEKGFLYSYVRWLNGGAEE